MFDPNAKINHKQKCLTSPQFKQLVINHNVQAGSKVIPVVKYFDGSASTWLLTELDPETGVGFGLADLGFGFPEIGYVDLNELMSIGTVNRDLYFKPDKTLQEYMNIAKEKGNLCGV